MKLDKAYRRDSKINKRRNSSKKYVPKNEDGLRKISIDKAIEQKRKEKEDWLESILEDIMNE